VAAVNGELGNLLCFFDIMAPSSLPLRVCVCARIFVYLTYMCAYIGVSDIYLCVFTRIWHIVCMRMCAYISVSDIYVCMRV